MPRWWLRESRRSSGVHRAMVEAAASVRRPVTELLKPRREEEEEEEAAAAEAEEEEGGKEFHQKH